MSLDIGARGLATRALKRIDNGDRPGIFSSNPARLPRYHAAVGRSLGGMARGRIAFIGDSETAGFGSGNVDGTNLYARSFPVALAGRLSNTEIGSRWGPAGIVAGQDITTLDPRVTWGAGWSVGGPFSLGGNAIYNNSTTNALNFAPVAAFDTIDVWYIRNTGLATFTVGVDGGAAAATIDASGAVGFVKTTVTVSAGTHTINIARTGVGGTLFIVGIDTYVASARKMAFWNMGACGSTTANWNDASTTYSPINALITVAPAAVGIMLGTNDMRTAVPLATSMANLQAIITAWKPTVNPFLITPLPSDTAVIAQDVQDAYRAELINLGSSNNIPVVDLLGVMGNWATATALGVMNDQLHGNAGGYQWEGTQLLPLVGY